jgi:RNA polymerase sigma-70 factor (ECF subfamily)
VFFPRNRASNPLSPEGVGVDSENPNLPDTELLRRAQAGDEDAFGELMRAHYEPTFRLIYSIIHDEHAARDVCQEVWVSVWRNISKFRGDAKFSTWIHPIAVRRSIDYLRGRQRWFKRFLPFLPGDDKDSDQPGPRTPEPVAETNPREETERHESRERFERALASLPPKHRAVLALREINGLSYDEIASTLSIRRGTVMSRLFNARRMLAKKLGDLPCD